MQRDLLPAAGRRPDVLFKAPEPVCGASGPPHGPAAAASNFYSAVGRNGILPQGFDQFYEAAPGPPFAGPQPQPAPAPPPQPEGAADKGDPKPGAGGGGGSPCAKATPGPEPKGAAEGGGGEGEGPPGEAGAEKSGGTGRRGVRAEGLAWGGGRGGGDLPLLAPFYVLLYKHSRGFIHPIRFPGSL